MPACVYIVATLVIYIYSTRTGIFGAVLPCSISSWSLVRVVITSNNKCGCLLVFVDGHGILVIFGCLYVRSGPELLVGSEITTIWRRTGQ